MACLPRWGISIATGEGRGDIPTWAAAGMPLWCCRSKARRARREDVYKVAEPKEEPPAEPVVKFSWDDRDAADTSQLVVKDFSEGTLFRKYDGKPVVIENCKESVIILLGHMTAVNVDDCRDCLIVLGPCSGSVFLRDLESCTVFAVCQQLRTRDCRDLRLGLRTMSEPIIEQSSDVMVHPYTIHYDGIKDDMYAAKLRILVNKADSVHDFTPDKARPNFKICDKILSVTDAQEVELEKQSVSCAMDTTIFPLPYRSYGTSTLFAYMGKTVEMRGTFYEETRERFLNEVCSNPKIHIVYDFDVDVIAKSYDALPLPIAGCSRVALVGVVGNESEFQRLLRRNPCFKGIQREESDSMVIAMKETEIIEDDEA